uniref:Delta-like protein n=1 Tax=Denticeps clupeoides TaxID=299321 RepID=A0AAY4AVF9_9TELE
LTSRCNALCAVVPPSCVPQIRGSGVFELDLREFRNGGGALASGASCAPDCRTFFRVCLKNYQAVVSPGDCIFGSAVTPVLGSNSFRPPRSPVRLPLAFAWPGSFSLIVEAWHSPSADLPVDTGDRGLLIGLFAVQRRLDVGPDWSPDVQASRHTELRYSYRFVCSDNYYGDKCSKRCAPRDDRFGHYSCGPDGQLSCLAGWRGEYCEEPICSDGCSTRNGTCFRPGECVCREGWQGKFCDECKKHPSCKHGTCEQPWQCNCKEGWGGIYCDLDLNFCTHHKPCVNGATCMNTGQGSYTCSCRPGFTGVNCEFEVKECDSNPCKNGALCTDLNPGYSCTCPDGYEGSHCEHSLLTCADSPCFHNGRCRPRDSGRSYACDCPRGYTGLNCEKRVDKCLTLPCTNGGLCVIHGGNRVCSCRTGFTGQRCEINVNECAGSPCLNGGTCLDRINDYACACTQGHAGRNCEREAAECPAKPCLNGGSCFAVPGNAPICLCPVGFTGHHCEYFAVTLPSMNSRGSQDGFQWTAVLTAVVMVVLLVVLCMFFIALRHICAQRRREGGDGEAMNNVSDVQRDNLIPASQLKNTNKKVGLEVDCTSEKSNHTHKNFHLDYNSSKDIKDGQLRDDKTYNYEKSLEEKVPLSRMCSEKPECRISTICSPRDSTYQSVFVIAEERRECVIATEVSISP